VGRLQDARLSRTDITAGREPKRAAFSKDVEERQEPIKTALDKLLEEAKPEKPGGKADTTKMVKMGDNEKRDFVETVDMAMARNDISPNTAVRALYDAMYKTEVAPKLVSDNKGGMVLSIGRERLVVDRDLYRRIASIRGEQLSAARVKTNEGVKAANEKATAEAGALAMRRSDIDDRQMQRREPGLIERAIGGTTSGRPAKVSPRGVLNEAARERWRKFNQENMPR
jgi:hypothetical protein